MGKCITNTRRLYSPQHCHLAVYSDAFHSLKVFLPSSSTASQIFSTSSICVLHPPRAILIQNTSRSRLCSTVCVKNVSDRALSRLWNFVLSKFSSASDSPPLPLSLNTTRVKDLGVTFSKISDFSIVEYSCFPCSIPCFISLSEKGRQKGTYGRDMFLETLNTVTS